MNCSCGVLLLQTLFAVLAQCRATATEIHPHYKRMYTGCVNEMTAVVPQLSAAPLTFKIK